MITFRLRTSGFCVAKFPPLEFGHAEIHFPQAGSNHSQCLALAVARTKTISP